MNHILLPYLRVFLFLISWHLPLLADEGMWIPSLLKQLNEREMKELGFKLTAEDVYSINRSSMKDAVVHFGRGCTGEMISAEGLLLTNHHCGIGQVQSHSTLENDYLEKGFWAANRSAELPNPGLTATFIIRIDDVSKEVFSAISETDAPELQDRKINEKIQEIVKKAKEGTHYDAFVRAMYGGNQYYLFIAETFRDVRLVGTPPNFIGNFGKDTDNWDWPRHTGDFCLFRVYADKDNKPADYSPDNVPFKPRHHFPISLKGVKENDFTMVYGFPGRTNEYLHSSAVDLIVNKSNPMKVDIREKKLEILKSYMDTSRKVYIQYADKYSGIANYWKKWSGESKGIRNAGAIQRKIQFENEFLKEVNNNTLLNEYAELLQSLAQAYQAFTPVQLKFDLYQEAILGHELMQHLRLYKKLEDALGENKDHSSIETIKDELRKSATGFYKDFHLPLSADLLGKNFYMALQWDAKIELIEPFLSLAGESNANRWKENALSLILSSAWRDEHALMQLLNRNQEALHNALKKDPLYQFAQHYWNIYLQWVLPPFQEMSAEISRLNRDYIAAQMKVFPEKRFYPDANGTLRVAYGKVEGYSTQDAVKYRHFTTAPGIAQKVRTGAPDYSMDERMAAMIYTKDYGRYADKKTGELHTCFIASNHTTGGNSGSPVLNAMGQLIGTNFDRNWEGTMSDIFYDIKQVRNIILDIRYTLWVIDKYANAGHLIQEMSLIE